MLNHYNKVEISEEVPIVGEVDNTLKGYVINGEYIDVIACEEQSKDESEGEEEARVDR